MTRDPQLPSPLTFTIFSMEGLMIFVICEMYGKSRSVCIVGVEADEHDELPIREFFLFGSDDLVCDERLSRNWESTHLHIDEIKPVYDSFGVDLTCFFALLVTTLSLEVETTSCLQEMLVYTSLL